MSAARIVSRSLIAVLALGALVVQGGAAWGARWVWDNEQLLKDQLVAQQFDVSSEIQELVTQAGLSETGELYLMTSLPQVVPAIEFARYCSRNEPGIGVLGCYTLNDRRIYLFDVTDPRLTSIEPVVAAHEMLHAAWARLTAAEKEEIAILLEEAFASLPSTHPLYERIASYESFSAASRIPELYSIIGTEIATIPAPLEAHYAQYFADRAKVVAHADAVDAVFESLQQELTDLSNELTSLNAEIDGLRFAYDEANAALRADINAFNEKASTPGAFPSKSQFEQARVPLQERQARLETMRSTLQSKIAEYNLRLDELTTLNNEVSELNQGINITLESKDELISSEETLSEN